MAKRRNTPVGPVQKPWPPVALRVMANGTDVKLRPGFTVAIGRADSNDLILRDNFVSERHCIVERPDPRRVLLRDLGSTNGTFINGVRIHECELVAGASVRVGQTFLAVSGEETIAKTAAEMLIGKDQAFREAIVRSQRIAATELSVLVLGETGTGKELVARLIHDFSPRAHAPFVAFNCAAIPRELIESELFGHEKGAFTGAADRQLGLFEQANGGTLFLDEVGELEREAQASLLRALESRKIRRVGGAGERPVDVRFIAATHCDLRAAALAGEFRIDLYHRLCGAEVTLPPLRLRRADIPLLIREFYGPAMTEETTDRILAHAWPGNVRELKNALRRAAALGESELWLDATPTRPPPAELAARNRIEDAIDVYGSYRKAAEALDMPRSTLHERARRYGVRKRPRP
jgi:DNA-binding NtrC family response regulator